jgi:hypothetical protein
MANRLAEFCDQYAPKTGPTFRAEAWYNRYGDSIHFHWCDDEFYADRIDDKLTVYRAIKSNEAVGCEMKGITALCKKLGDFGISLKEQDGTPLAMFLIASQATAMDVAKEPEARQEIYRYLLEQVGKRKVEIEESTPLSPPC